ncbi:hypothetical protein [Seonamhaeicola sp.]|uniref:hypothetical protein n=1 Tax=Seonamhaeicola sp. TaxID=1912245 RepID=UPI00260320FF|nr:hypothetical protein [Seonamhaeicola sp.]
MKILKTILYTAIIFVCLSCEEEPQLYNFEEFKFVSFIDQSGEILENGDTYIIALRYDGSVLTEGFSVNLEIAGNAQEGTDYSVVNKVVNFEAGEIKSEPFEITIIDNLVVNDIADKMLEISIASVSNPNIDIGVGKILQSNKAFALKIIDNECTESVADVFNSSNIHASYGDSAVSASVSGDLVTLNGNLVGYGSFPDAELGITLTPVVPGATIGTATFENYAAGTDTAGYEYQFRQNGEGTFDVCTGQIMVGIDVYYLNLGTTSPWIYWYTANTTFAAQ